MVEGCSDHIHLTVSAALLSGLPTDGSPDTSRVFKGNSMPFVMLKKDWPGTFRRTITVGKKGKEYRSLLEFQPGVPRDLSQAELAGVIADIGLALQPIEFDAKGRPRLITDEVLPAESAEEISVSEPQSAN
jgi:hypothetical protein